MRALLLALEILIPPVFFLRRRRWVGLALTCLLFLAAMGSLVAEHGAFPTPESRRRALAFAAFFWGWSVFGVAASAALAWEAARKKVVPPPLAPLRRRLAEAALIVAVIVAMFAGPALIARIEDPGPGGTDVQANLIEETRWEAEWIVDLARAYRREKGANPGTLEVLRATLPRAATVATTDAWRRPWVLSPELRDTRTLRKDGDLWVCSRGPLGHGRCPPEGPVTSIGYSSSTGRWQTPPQFVVPPTAFLQPAAFFVPLVAYLAYRIVRRLRGRSVPRVGPGPSAVVFVAVLVVILAVLLPLYAGVGARARIAKAEADTRAIVSVITIYRAHMGVIPTTLAELTTQATNAHGQVAGPFMSRVPRAPFGGEPGYRYRPWADGRYVVIWVSRTDAFAVFRDEGFALPGRGR